MEVGAVEVASGGSSSGGSRTVEVAAVEVGSGGSSERWK